MMAKKMIRRRISRLIKLFAFLSLVVLVFVSCSKLTKENYDKVKLGMDYDQVVKIIGDPEKCDSLLNAKNCVWGDESKAIEIKFVADKVVFTSSKGL
jgi:hypothetical protein